MKDRFRAVLIAVVVWASLSPSYIAKSQSVTNQGMAVTPSSPSEADKQRWKREKEILVSIVEKIEARLREKYRKWKTSTKEVLMPPEFSSQHCSAQLVGKSRSRIETKISLLNSLAEASQYYHLDVQMLASGRARPLKLLADEAVSIEGGYSRGGQVRFLKQRFWVIVHAHTTQEAIEIAGIIKSEIDTISPGLPPVD